MKFIGDAIEFCILWVVYWFIFVLPSALAIGLVQELDPHPVVSGGVLLACAIWYFAAMWFAVKAASSRVGGAGFGESMFAGVPEARMTLSYLPVVGNYFAPPPKSRDKDQQADG